jgi:hypothetical protein
MSEVELNQKSFVCHRGVILTYRDNDRWAYTATSGDITIHGQAIYTNPYCARYYALEQMKAEHEIDMQKPRERVTDL